MADITSALQSAVDNDGSYTLPSGTSTVSSTITIDGQLPFWIKGRATSVLEWSGSADTPMFEWVKGDGVSAFKKVLFEHVNLVSEVSGVALLRGNGQSPTHLTVSHCEFQTTGAYCIDFVDCPYTVTPYFENIRTTGSGALRFRASIGGADPAWLSSLMEIKNWLHIGSDRVGPAFDLYGTRGLKLWNIRDAGSPALLEALRGNFACPVSLRWNVIAHPSQIQNYVVDYDEDFTNAPGCYLHEIRTDTGTSVGKQEQLKIQGMTMHNYDIDSGVKHVRIMGGNGSTAAHGLFVEFEACEDLDGDQFLVGGKTLIRCKNIWYNPGQTSKLTAMKNLVESLDTDTWATPIQTATDRPPRSTITTPLYEEGEDLYDNRTDDVGDFETVLENL